MIFWLIVSGLLLCALVFMAWLILKPAPKTGEISLSRIARNVSIYRQRLAYYENEKKSGLLDDHEFEEFCLELSHRLLEEVEQLETSASQGKQRRLWLLLPMPIVALLMYFFIGAYPDWKISETLIAISQASSEQEYQALYKDLHNQLEKRISTRSDNTDYRFMLAQYAMIKQDYAQAASHYGVLVELIPNDADIWAYYAQAEYLRANRELTPLVIQAIDKSLAINPMQKTVLGLQGIEAFESEKWQEAINAWEKLLLVVEDTKSAEMIAQGIQKAKDALGKPTVTVSNSDVAQAGVKVMVQLGKDVPALDANLSVFIYAKAVNGPPMPLAVKRMSVKDLPVQVELNDAMAMMPQMKLSSYEKVVVGARISLNGNPVAQKGDWQAESEPVLWRENNQQTVLINRIVD